MGRWEMLRLKLTSLQADDIGTMIYTVRRDVKGGEDIWRLISQNYISSSDSQQYSAVGAKAESFRPLFSHTVNLLGDFAAEYGDKKIKLQSTGAGGELQKDIDVNSVVYDNEQLVHLIRRMPLRDDFKTSFALFSATSETVVDCSIAVAGKERVETAAGTFDSYRVNLTMRSVRKNLRNIRCGFGG